MMWRIVLFLSASIVVSSAARAGDWRVWGTVPDKDVLMLYSASDVKRDGNNVRVWMEILSAKDVASFDVNTHPEVMDRVIARARAGYRPPYATQLKMGDIDMVNVALAEEIANEKASPILIRSLYEIDCVEARNRVLALTQWNNKGEQIYNMTAPAAWEYTPPDTPLAHLTEWVCASAEPKMKGH
jgi:hypothetical protein